MTPPRALTIIPLLLLLSEGPVHAQLLRGRVVDAASGEGVAQARITALANADHDGRGVRSAADGSFVLVLRAPGSYRVQVERGGYQATLSAPVAVAARETVLVTLRMASQATTLEPLTVTARQAPPRRPVLVQNGFYDREARGFGRFLRREDLERVPENNLVRILARVPGVTIETNRNRVEIVTFTRSRTVGTIARTQTGQKDFCFPAVYLDGVRMTYGDQSGTQPAWAGRDDANTPDLNNIIHSQQVEAVELYRSAAEIPAEFNGSNAACGVIVLWSRHEMDPVN